MRDVYGLYFSSAREREDVALWLSFFNTCGCAGLPRLGGDNHML